MLFFNFNAVFLTKNPLRSCHSELKTIVDVIRSHDQTFGRFFAAFSVAGIWIVVHENRRCPI